MIHLPEEFLDRMKTLLGADFSAFLASYENPPTRGLHVNSHKINPETLTEAVDFPVEPIPYTRDGFTFDCEKIGNHPLHHAGAIYVQEPSAMLPLSMLPGDLLPDQPRILDVCAAPGGKSSQAANLFAGRGGFLVANEVVPKRCLTLAENIERLGIRNAMVTGLSADALGELFDGVFDLTVVDAPCSGEGMFRKNPAAVEEWSPENVQNCAIRQRQILSAVAGTVRPGGYLLYSTCTFSPEENEETVEYFLENHPEFEPVDPPQAVKAATTGGRSSDGSEMSFCRRFYPHLAPGEGQFAALFRRKSGESDGFCYKSDFTAPSKADSAIVRDFLAEVLGDSGRNLTLEARKDGIYAVNPDFPIPPKGVLSPGVKIGVVQKGRLIPDHRFFMAYGGDFVNRLELDSNQAVAYLKGNTVVCDTFTGWGVVTYHGCTLGGIKVSGGVAKNHYPKGLRILG